MKERGLLYKEEDSKTKNKARVQSTNTESSSNNAENEHQRAESKAPTLAISPNKMATGAWDQRMGIEKDNYNRECAEFETV